MEQFAIQKRLKIQSQKRMMFAILLMAILGTLIPAVLYSKRKQIEEHDRMEIVINSLVKEKSKAKFSVIASIFEDVYHLLERENAPTQEKLYEIINTRIKILGSDKGAQEEFEKALNKESGNIMISFRNEYPNLSPEEYRIASCLFAGFDNTTIMLIMGITTLEYTRVKKNRLKCKIQRHPSPLKDIYLEYF